MMRGSCLLVQGVETDSKYSINFCKTDSIILNLPGELQKNTFHFKGFMLYCNNDCEYVQKYPKGLFS